MNPKKELHDILNNQKTVSVPKLKHVVKGVELQHHNRIENVKQRLTDCQNKNKNLKREVRNLRKLLGKYKSAIEDLNKEKDV